MAEDESKKESADKSVKYAYLDLLATTLTEHEKNLDKLIERLERISENLAELSQTGELEEPARSEVGVSKPEQLETLTYMKIKLNRPADELKKIVESLKE